MEEFINVLAIMPYPELAYQLEKEAVKFPGLRVTCRTGNLDQGLEIAREELRKNHYDIILSRGGTAEVLRKNIRDVCIQEIRVSFEDVFYAMMLARSYKEKYAVVSYSALTRQARTVNDLLGYDLEICSIQSREETLKELRRLRDLGYSMIVGDVFTSQIAEELGLNYVLIMSGENSIHEALYFAENLLTFKQQVKMSAPSVLFHEEDYKSGSVKLMKTTDDAGYAFQSRYGAVNSVGHTRDAINDCSNTHLPVLIMGEPGTGKVAAAQAIYQKGPYHNNPCYVIHCGTVTDREWTRFFNKTSSPLLSVNSTILFKNVEMISPANARRLQKLIEESTLCRSNKVIFCAVSTGEIPPFAKYLLDEVPCVLLQPLPIRERIEDLRNILVIYMNELNIELGKQIIGFEDKAREEFLNYSWPGNITQLKRVLREIMNSTEGAFITSDKVKYYIRNEIFEKSEDVSFNIDLNQTLSDINYDVVRMVMKEENMNQSRTAERLGVGRTTIWRILKQYEGKQ